MFATRSPDSPSSSCPHEGWVQGEVARAAAKVIVERDRLTVLVPAMLGAHVEERIRADAAEVLTA